MSSIGTLQKGLGWIQKCEFQIDQTDLDPILLLAHDGRISQMDLETGTVKFLADTRSEAGGMDFHVYNQVNGKKK